MDDDFTFRIYVGVQGMRRGSERKNAYCVTGGDVSGLLSDYTLSGTFDELRFVLRSIETEKWVGAKVQALITDIFVNGKKCSGNMSFGNTSLITI